MSESLLSKEIKYAEEPLVPLHKSYGNNVEIEMCDDEYGGNEETEEIDNQVLSVLVNVVDDNNIHIERTLSKISNIRRELFLKGETRFMFNFFFCFPNYIEFDFDLLWTQIGEGTSFFAYLQLLTAFSHNF